jgi:hypothetical protein
LKQNKNPGIFLFGFNNLIFIYLFKYKNIETHARAFWPLNISAVGSVYCLGPAETLEGPISSLALSLSVLSALLSKLPANFSFLYALFLST